MAAGRRRAGIRAAGGEPDKVPGSQKPLGNNPPNKRQARSQQDQERKRTRESGFRIACIGISVTAKGFDTKPPTGRDIPN